MHTIEQIKAELKRLDQIIGVDTSGIAVAFSPRAVYQYGCCNYQKVNGRVFPRKILIASFLLEEEEAFWDTVRHEYAHAAAALLTGKNQGHGPVWQSICRQIGVDPVRLAAECPAQQKQKEARVKYEIVCLSCGVCYRKVRRGRFVDAVLASGGNPTAYRCVCGGRRFSCKFSGGERERSAAEK
ncbi:MAG: SprT-like domain-containing protein [Oscillospiraceae bacterium]|nr:SprT-like domain-containing protein [Oscillospiraceae bacterium]